MSYSCAVIGNSSSGIIEAPFLKVSTVNIGDRQKGRVMADSIVSCQNSYEDIIHAIQTSLQYKWSKEIIENPYEKEDTSYQIIRAIKQELKKNIQLNKSFYDLGVDHV
jgi:UDP-N-acetylglucosamine 2-epimerase (non-hydrolysing)/GDP/UDP-N,N'-diacetylbacillosamine 2-epimerase (hydrolysing)